jgi:hypothetical protein
MELLNRSAPKVFGIIREAPIDDIPLRLARLTDPCGGVRLGFSLCSFRHFRPNAPVVVLGQSLVRGLRIE